MPSFRRTVLGAERCGDPPATLGRKATLWCLVLECRHRVFRHFNKRRPKTVYCEMCLSIHMSKLSDEQRDAEEARILREVKT